MAISFMQKIRLWLRGWSRRRDEDARRKQEEFLRANTGWGTTPVVPAAPVRETTAVSVPVDLDGLQVAFLDDSGRIAHFFDVQTGEVVEFPAGESHPEIAGQPDRYRRIPVRTEASEAEDRQAFVTAMEPSVLRDRLAAATVGTEFRKLLATDRAAERSWYNFKNDRAMAAIKRWLVQLNAER